jgi:hypothetical protein
MRGVLGGMDVQAGLALYWWQRLMTCLQQIKGYIQK